MRVRIVRSGVAIGIAALAMSALGAVPAEADPGAGVAPPVSGVAVPVARGGEVLVWGENDQGQATVPASLAGVAVTQVVMPEDAVLALTADGRVVGWGGNYAGLQKVPSAVEQVKVAQLATNANSYAGAVTRDGRVLTWGYRRTTPTPLDVPAGLSGVTQLALSERNAVALKADGSVVAWGATYSGINDVPPGLKATAIATTVDSAFALTDQGTVVAWGHPTTVEKMSHVTQSGNVTAISARTYGVLALLADGSVVQMATNGNDAVLPTSVDEAEMTGVASGCGRYFAAVDRDGVIHHWNPEVSGGGVESGQVPAELNGRALAQVALSCAVIEGDGAVLITKMLRAESPQVTGTATVGSVLTGVPGTFSGSPDAVSSQWLVDGAPVAGATLSLTPALVGKTIVYQSTATKAGETTISATSTAVTVTEPAKPKPPAVASQTKVLKVKVAKRAKKLAVTGTVTASKSPAGKAKVTIKKGKKTIVAKDVKVSAKGEVQLTVKKFGKLVIKKLTPKKKGKKGKKGKKPSYYGKYVVTIDYAGNAQVDPSKAAKKFTVKKTKGKKGKK